MQKELKIWQSATYSIYKSFINGSKLIGTIIVTDFYLIYINSQYLCSIKIQTKSEVNYKYFINQNLYSMTEKERWQLVGTICTAIGGAITVFFSNKK